MYLHRDNRELFYDVLELTAERQGVAVDIVEKDYYETVSDNSMGGLKPYVKLETALMSYAFPTVEKEIGNYIFMALGDEEPDIIEKFGLMPFTMSVQATERTMIDKIFALCDYYMLNRANRNSRHLYDIYKLAPHISKDDSFKNLVKEVRLHRMKMDEKVAPSARENVDIAKLIHKICAENFYKQDYADATIRLISDNVSYETVRDFYSQFTEGLF